MGWATRPCNLVMAPETCPHGTGPVSHFDTAKPVSGFCHRELLVAFLLLA